MFGLGRKKSGARGPAPGLSVVKASETGLVRKENQDSLLADSALNVFCVADGMGGGAEGARASAIVCDCIRRNLADAGDGFVNRMEAVAIAIADANSSIFSYSKSRGYKQMGSTAAALVFEGEKSARAALCYVGDSRIYRFRRGLASPLTRDHSVGVELGSMAGASMAESFFSRANPLSHVLTRSVGTDSEVRPDWHKVDVRKGDRFLICSDGVHDVISDSRLGFLIGYGELEKARERLEAEIVKCGAPDNYSFIILEVPKSK